VRSRWITVTVLAAAVIAGCGSAPPAAAPPAAPLPPAAEPAPAPAPTAPPAGRTVPVGAAPEGVVVDPQTHVVAVGVRDPAALTLLDATTGMVLRKVPLPGALRHLQLAGPGGPVLVPDEGANRLLRVALPGGEITSQVVTGVVPLPISHLHRRHAARWAGGCRRPRRPGRRPGEHPDPVRRATAAASG
jgi:hypothetical protein